MAGNTEVGIEAKFKGMISEKLISTQGIAWEIRLKEDVLEIGGGVTLSRVESFLETEPEDCGFRAMLDMLRWFASSQIRNVATLAGNIVTASPISDMNPVLIGLGATFVLQSAARGERRVAADAFFKAYRTVDLAEDEILTRIEIPRTRGSEHYVRAFKQARRRDDDISTANACMKVSVKGDVVQEAVIAFGGMAPTAVRARAVEEALVGSSIFDLDIDFGSALKKDVGLPEVAPGGMTAYRQTLCSSFLYKFRVAVAMGTAPACHRKCTLPLNRLSAPRPATSGRQSFPSAAWPQPRGRAQGASVSPFSRRRGKQSMSRISPSKGCTRHSC